MANKAFEDNESKTRDRQWNQPNLFLLSITTENLSYYEYMW